MAFYASKKSSLWALFLLMFLALKEDEKCEAKSYGN